MKNRRPSPARLLVACALILLAPLSAGAAPPSDSPLYGRWEYVAEGSEFSGRAPYQRATLTISPEDGGLRTAEEVVTANGSVFHFEYLDPLDGSYVAVARHPYYDAESTSLENEYTAIRHERRGGEDIGQTVMKVSPDGNSLVAEHDRIVPEGTRYTARVNWKRADP